MEFAVHRSDHVSLVLLSSQCAALCLSRASDACWTSFGPQMQEWLQAFVAIIQSQTEKSSSQASTMWYALALQLACAASMSPAACPQAVGALLVEAAAAPTEGCFSSTESTEAFLALLRLRLGASSPAVSAWAHRPGAHGHRAAAAAMAAWSLSAAASSQVTQATAAVVFALTGIVAHVLELEPQAALLLLPLLVAAAVAGQQGLTGPFSAGNMRSTQAYIAGGIKGQVFRSKPSSLGAFLPSLGELAHVQRAAEDLTLPTPPAADTILTMVQVDLQGVQVQRMDPATREYLPVQEGPNAGLPPPGTGTGSEAGDMQPHGAAGVGVGGIGAAEGMDPLEQLRQAAGLGAAPAAEGSALAVQLLPTGGGVAELPAMLAQHASQHTENGGSGPLLLGGDSAFPGAMPMPLPADLLQTLQDLQSMLHEAGDTRAAAEVQAKVEFAQGLVAGGGGAPMGGPVEAGIAESKE